MCSNILLFMIRNAPVGNMHIPEVAADSAIKTYYALPEDVRNFTVIYMDEGPAYMTPQEQLDYWYGLLDLLEVAKIPVVLQSECFCTNKQRDPNNFRETAIEPKGFSEKPTVSAAGTNGAKLSETWNAETATLTLKVISNGRVMITVE